MPAFAAEEVGTDGACTEQPQSVGSDVPSVSPTGAVIGIAAGSQQQWPPRCIIAQNPAAGADWLAAPTRFSHCGLPAPGSLHIVANTGFPPMVQTIARISVSTGHSL